MLACVSILKLRRQNLQVLRQLSMTISNRTTRNRFPKRQRLCSRKSIETLFEGGNGSKAVSAFPLRAVWQSSNEPTRILISVSKRKLTHAVDRNRVKRQIREAWRLNQYLIENLKINIAIIWLSEIPQTTETVSRKMRNLLHRISESYSLPQSDSTNDSSRL